ncbi:MAG: hypothetical protein KAJ73_00230 [Zetaproteobacteria bacterium]|nr:hypothetical protein [Zetaproteobacteria bacterium]
MGYLARATTGKSGMQLMGGFDIHDLKTDPTASRDSPWTLRVNKMSRTKFGKLLGKSAFDLLARYIMKDLGLLANHNCLHGYAGRVRVIRIKGFQYREWMGSVHKKTLKGAMAEHERIEAEAAGVSEE